MSSPRRSGGAQVGLEGAEQTGSELAIGREPHPIASVTEIMAHRSDHADRPRGSGKPVVRGWTVSGWDRLRAPGLPSSRTRFSASSQEM